MSLKFMLKNIVKNSKCIAKTLIERGIDIVSGGTDNHIVLLDLRKKVLLVTFARKLLRDLG